MPAELMNGKPTAMRSLVLGIALACIASQTTAEDDDMPGADFLEFLGSWEEGDQDWLAIALEMAEAEATGETEESPGSAETDNENE